MRLKKITINNFRSIKNCSINVGNLCALVGENNVGKSSVLRALNAFFNYEDEKEDFDKGKHHYSSNTKPKIELTFCDVPDKGHYRDKIVNDELTLQMIYPKSEEPKLNYKTANRRYDNINIDFIDKMKQDIHFFLISNARDYTQAQIKQSEETLLKKLLNHLLKEHTSGRDTISPKFHEAMKKMERSGFSKIQKNIEKYYSLSHDFKFKISYDEGLDYSAFLNNISLGIIDHETYFSLGECGSGIQSMSIIALYRFLAHKKHTKFVLGIEEPETNLHPQSQRELIKSIKRKDYDTNEIQMIFTTHSAVIADQLDHNELVLFKRIPDEKRGFKTTCYQIPDNFYEKYGLDNFKYYQFYKYRNSEFFFAKFVIVVESKNDAEVVKKLLEQKKKDLDVLGVSIINLEGIDNLKYPYYLLKCLKLPYILILDKDFFVPYFNDKLDDSRYNSGFPKYRYEFKNNHLEIIRGLIEGENDREKLLSLLKTNHSKALDLLEKYNIICFKYSLEVDLVNSGRAQKELYNVLKIPLEKQNTRELLVERKEMIKKPDILLQVLEELPNRNLPNSYKRIKNSVERTSKNPNQYLIQ
ncbi:MAG: AAA family ATPase [Halobacteriota archaeon]|nr:AAA family ATPase [Halobacteriota archaeon]